MGWIDGSIPAGVQTARINTPFEHLSQLLAIREQQQRLAMQEEQQRQREQQAQEQQRAVGEQQQLRDLIAGMSANGMPITEDTLLPALQARGMGDTALKLQGQFETQAKTRADALKAHLENQDKVLGLVNKLANPESFSTDPTTAEAQWQAMRPVLQQNLAVLHPELAKRVPDHYDPQTVQQIQALTVSKQDVLAAHKESADALAQGPKTAGDWLKVAAPVMATTTGPEDTAAQLAGLQSLGVPASVLKLFQGDSGKALAQQIAPPAEKKTQDEFQTFKQTFAAQQQAAGWDALSPEQQMAGLKAFDTRRPSIQLQQTDQSAADVKEAVQAMKEGKAPPILPGRATREYTAMIAESHRQGYDLASAALDWSATQHHLSALNSTQQLKLNQSINTLPGLLDSVDALASQWKGSQFPVLNRANLALAKNGAYGEAVASVARRLDAQIADVTADLGNVYMGGNSPTDQALQLAARSLSSDWSEKVLKDMVALARQNVATRLNSIKTTGVAGGSATNPYDRTPAPMPETPTAAPGGVGLTYQDYLKARGGGR